jgi:hypothetical protein
VTVFAGISVTVTPSAAVRFSISAVIVALPTPFAETTPAR